MEKGPYSDCERCNGWGKIRLPTWDARRQEVHARRWIVHWCPDCSRPPRVDERGEWTAQPFRFVGEMTHLVESYAEAALRTGQDLYHPVTGRRVRAPWWQEMVDLRDQLRWQVPRRAAQRVD